MKKIIALLFFISAFSFSAFAQPLLSEFNKAKEIKLLDSNRKDVKRILAGYEHDKDYDDEYKQDFSTKNAKIEITFSKGNCSDDSEYWNVPEWTVTRIKISPEDTIKLKDFNFDFSGYKKETEEDDLPEFYRLHNENAGIVFDIDDGEMEEIFFYPPKNKAGFLCSNEKALTFLSGERKLTDLLYDPIYCPPPASVTNLTLSANELISCDKSAKDKKCSDKNMKISVTTEAFDAENDTLVYEYKISAGKIVGNGKQVVWDLSGVSPGTYTITAGVDDGCGFCGETKTKEVIVK